MSYRIYTTEFDEVIHARDLGEIPDAAVMERFDAHALKDDRRSPDLDLSDFPRTGEPVTFLLDLSGSQRDNPINRQRLALQMLGDRMDAEGIPFRILGHTTRAWKGGRSRDKWVADGRPKYPGRLNELRIVVFHEPQDAWKADRGLLNHVLIPGLLKENLDGEAIEIAAGMPGKGRIVWLSDGKPMDDATLMANDNDFLDRHLHHVLSDMSGKREIVCAMTAPVKGAPDCPSLAMREGTVGNLVRLLARAALDPEAPLAVPVARGTAPLLIDDTPAYRARQGLRDEFVSSTMQDIVAQLLDQVEDGARTAALDLKNVSQGDVLFMELDTVMTVLKTEGFNISFAWHPSDGLVTASLAKQDAEPDEIDPDGP